MDIRDFEPLFGNWYVESFIGSGSYGKVYRIKREDFGATYYSALKWISIPRDESELMQLRYDNMDDESISQYYKSLVGKLTNEIQLMSRLRGHSNLVSYEDHAVIPKPREMGYDIFIRMELLTSLKQHLQAAHCADEDVIRLGIDICYALEMCQRHNIIHRDIKPDNIFWADSGSYKLGDFGIARQLEHTVTELSIKGTYNYMAPEIYKGEQYNSSVDIYSLGIVLYQLLNGGRLPFLPPAPEQILPDDKEQSLVRRMNGERMPPPQNAQGRLGKIILKACAFDPKDRYSSSKQMREELQSIQCKPAIDDKGDDGKTKKGNRTKDWLLIAAAAIALIVLAVGVGFILKSLAADTAATALEQTTMLEPTPTPIAEKKTLLGNASAIEATDQENAIAVTATPKLTEVPAVTPDAVSLNLSFGEQFSCDTGDFNLPYQIDNEEVTWSCASNDAGTTCSSSGVITAGNIQVDIEAKYNEPIKVTGSTTNGSTLIYYVTTGSGTTYDAQWSEYNRTMKTYLGRVIVLSPMVENCTGFTINYIYELSEGIIYKNNWSLWVRENGTDWVFIQDITAENGVSAAHEITFERPITFSEIAIQPPKQDNSVRYTQTFGIGSLVFDISDQSNTFGNR